MRPALALLALGLLIGSSARADVVLYNQSPQFPGNFGGTWTSDFGFDPQVPGNRGFWTFDNFRPVVSGRIDRVTYQGMYWDFRVNGNNPVVPDTTTWELAVWRNSPGGFFPGAQLSSQTLPAASVRREFQGFAFLNGLPGVPLPVYTFTADLPQPVAVQAGQDYWLSVLGLSPSFNPVWLWMPGNGPDATSIQYTLGANRTVTGGQYVGGDRAFTLRQVVPEPLSLGVFGGLAAVSGLAARRRMRAAV